MTRGSILLSIAFPIIIVGIFVIVVFAAVNYENLTIEVYAILTLVTVFVFLFGFAIGQRFASPVKQLLEKVEQLSRGELTSRIYLETKNEFEELAQAFNKMAEELQKSHTIAEQAEDVANIKIKAKTQELEEIINNLEQKVKGRAQELQKMIQESEYLQNLVKNREVEVVNLKKEVKQIKEASEEKRKPANSSKKPSVNRNV